MNSSPLSRFNLFRNLKLRNKLLVIYGAVTAFALILLLLLLRSHLGGELLKHEKQLLTDSLEQGAAQIQSRLDVCTVLSDVIYNNPDLLEACNISYGDRYFDMYAAYTNKIEPPLVTYRLLNPWIRQITVYSDCGLIAYKNLVEPLETLKEEDWFYLVNEKHSPVWIYTGEETPLLRVFRKFPQNSIYPYENYLCLDMSCEEFFRPLTTLSADSYGLVITDSAGAVIYEYHSFDSDSSPVDPSVFSGEKNPTKEQQDHYVFLTSTLSYTGWTLHYYKPLSALSQTVNATVGTSFFLIAFCFILLLFLTFLCVTTFLTPLSRFTAKIGSIGSGDISEIAPFMKAERKDEIGILVQTFNHMLDRIQTLISEVYVNRLNAREYQLKALRAQINPHFLYNTLSLINSKAIIAEQEEISRMAQLLSQFYRTSLNHGNDMTTIGNELENIRTYIEIQLLLCSNSFAVFYDIDDTLKEYPMPNLILQPIVENAIDHGLRNCHKPGLALSISLTRDGACIRIAISDNGCGMSLEEQAVLLSRDSRGIGMKNVDERLRLSYGGEYGLIMESRKEEGTKITVRIPVTQF